MTYESAPNLFAAQINGLSWSQDWRDQTVSASHSAYASWGKAIARKAS